MTKIDIVSGFLGAGKTTLIKKLLKEALAGTQTVLIENEFGRRFWNFFKGSFKHLSSRPYPDRALRRRQAF